jgi:hypothetical protein
MNFCYCSEGADPGCHICSPEKWEENNNVWSVKKEKEMNEEQSKQDALQKQAEDWGKEPQLKDPMQLETSTRLLDKNYSPLIVRKYQMWGWPLFISLICDISLSDLDKVIKSYKKLVGKPSDDIQEIRNWCGGLSDYLCEHYDNIKDGCVEGVAVLWYVDKMFVSSLYGDFMVHASCKAELFAIINTLPHI